MKIPLNHKEKDTLRKLREWSQGFTHTTRPLDYAIKIAELTPEVFEVLESMEREYLKVKSYGEAAIDMNKNIKRSDRLKKQENFKKFHNKNY
jgi:hypothetical protein